jgi:hypothetical protein
MRAAELVLSRIWPLAVDTRCTPKWVRLAYPANESRQPGLQARALAEATNTKPDA